MGFKEFKKALSESNLSRNKTPKETVEVDEEIEQVYLEDTPWIDYLLRVQENYVILGAHSGKPIAYTPGGLSIGMGFKAAKLHKVAKDYNIITPPCPIDNVTFVLVEYNNEEKSILALSDNTMVSTIEKKCIKNDLLSLSEEESEQLRILIKGYKYILQF